MSVNAFYLSVEQSSSTSGSTGGPTTQKTWAAAQHHHSAEVKTKCWTFKQTEINMESGIPEGCVEEVSSSATGVQSGSDQSSCSTPCTSTRPSTSVAEDRGSFRSEVRPLPKNAVELIAWAITECNTTTPTLSQIATHIQAHVSTYRDQELSVLIRMVQHHLNRNNPAFFLPVMSHSGRHPHNPNLARWAINRQVVMVREDGSLVRRCHRSHAYTGRRSIHSPSPLATPTSHHPAPIVVTPPDGASSGSGHTPHFANFTSTATDSYYSPTGPGLGPPTTTLLQPRPSLGGPFTMFGSCASPILPPGQPPAMGTGMYGVPVSAPGGMGTLSAAPSLGPGPSPAAGIGYQLSLC
ncbi:uncharacterized protein LOC143281423 [Babylonia areolata]|uniref:uncharacterized protein LOC143281423 n=1 Tax=Babylonia areolata TaxID=304850 RepID=UPI003FCF3343